MRPDGEALHKAETVRADILALLREKRYEEALALLYRTRAESPGNRELQKSIDQVKEFLVGAYAKRLGGLDRVAAPIPATAQRSPDVVMLARYIDGSSTIGDIAQMCPLGQLRTLQVMVGLYTGAEPPRVDAGLDALRVDTSKEAQPRAPTSGLRLPQEPAPIASRPHAPEIVERAPETARSASAPGVQSSPGVPRSVQDVPRSVQDAPRSAQDVPRSSQAFGPISGGFGPRSAPLSEGSRQYEEAFSRGTAAFVQRRYNDAILAFEECVRMRPDDQAAAVMIRRCERGLKGGG